MKNNLKTLVAATILLLTVYVVSAINPVELIKAIPSPPPPDTVRVTINLGMTSCEELSCSHWEVTVYTTGPGGDVIVYGPFTYSGWYTFTTPPSLADPSAEKICVLWHFVSTPPPPCNTTPGDKNCCIRFNGSGNYSITCNPCY